MNRNNPEIDSLGNKYWRNEFSEYHRENGLPAIEFFDGTKSWWKNGFIYRWDELIVPYL